MRVLGCATCLLLLQACSGYKDNFSCSVGEGVACTSLSEINTMIDQKKIGALSAKSEVHEKTEEDDEEKKESYRVFQTVHVGQDFERNLVG